jgi:hypothetical protein
MRRVIRRLRNMRKEPHLSADWISTADRSHPNVKLVDEFRREMTYDGHREDIDKMESAHLEGDTFTFEQASFGINERENGDRSHPRLKKLDSLRYQVTYDGWKKD